VRSVGLSLAFQLGLQARPLLASGDALVDGIEVLSIKSTRDVSC
jgi:hypothetical protein